jgi:hypothetical protein
MLDERIERHLAEDVGGEPLLSVLLLESLLPVGGSELQDPLGRPGRSRTESTASSMLRSGAACSDRRSASVERVMDFARSTQG